MRSFSGIAVFWELGDDGNWILASQFAEAAFDGTWRAIFIGVDAFKETGHTRWSMYLWAALQTHRVLQGYIELGFVAHSEVISVAVEHLVQTRVPMAMHEALWLDSKRASKRQSPQWKSWNQ
jgi:hypothetical protein